MLKFISLFLVIFSFCLQECQAQKQSELDSIAFFSGVNVVSGKTACLIKTGDYEFYDKGSNRIENETVILEENDNRIGKVKSVYSPSKESFSHQLFFLYEEGITTIYETPQRATIYRFGPDNLIHSIEQHERLSSGLMELYRKEVIYREYLSTSFRITIVREDREGTRQAYFSFSYDQDGFLKEEMIAGNLSGKCTTPIVIDQNGCLESNGVETYRKIYDRTEILKQSEIQERKIFENQPYHEQSPLLFVSLNREDSKAQTVLSEIISADSHPNSIEYFYDAFGRIASIEFPDGESDSSCRSVMKQEYNIFNLVTKIILHSGSEIRIDYNCRGQCTGVYYSDGTFESYTYYLDGQLMESFLRDGSHYIFLDSEESCHNDENYRSSHLDDIEQGLDEIRQFDPLNQEETGYEHKISALYYSCLDQLSNILSIMKQKIKEEPTLVIAFNDSLDAVIKTLSGNYYQLLGCSTEETIKDSYGSNDLNEKVRISFINGMLNSKSMMLENLNFISGAHGNVKVHYIFRPTQGWVWDISRAILIKFGYTLGFRSKHAHLLAELWKSLIDEMGGVDNGGVILHYAHSLGGTDTDRAHDLLTPEEQKMIRVITIGSATFVNNHNFQRVENHVSINDGVHFLDPWGHLRYFIFGNNHIQFHGLFSRTSLPIIDHMLDRNTYKNLIYRLGAEFLAEFSSN